MDSIGNHLLPVRGFVVATEEINGGDELSIWYGSLYCRALYVDLCRCVQCCKQYHEEDHHHDLKHTCCEEGDNDCQECKGQEEDVADGLNPYTEAGYSRQVERQRGTRKGKKKKR